MNTAVQNKQQDVRDAQQELKHECDKQSDKDSQKHNETMQQVSRASKIIDTDVRNSSGDRLGTIKELVLDPFTGHMAYAVLTFGGVFGLGDKLFAVPWKALHWSRDNEHYTLNVDKSTLDKASGFDKDHWPEHLSNWQNIRVELEQLYCCN